MQRPSRETGERKGRGEMPGAGCGAQGEGGVNFPGWHAEAACPTADSRIRGNGRRSNERGAKQMEDISAHSSQGMAFVHETPCTKHKGQLRRGRGGRRPHPASQRRS